MLIHFSFSLCCTNSGYRVVSWLLCYELNGCFFKTRYLGWINLWHEKNVDCFSTHVWGAACWSTDPQEPSTAMCRPMCIEKRKPYALYSVCTAHMCITVSSIDQEILSVFHFLSKYNQDKNLLTAQCQAAEKWMGMWLEVNCHTAVCL